MTVTKEKSSKDTRKKVLKVAIREFAKKGFEAVSTRDITEMAGVNLSSIKYYFGDKEGLYRAAVLEPFKEQSEKIRLLELSEKHSLEESLRCVLFLLVDPLKEGEDMEWCMKIRIRESIERTGLLDSTDSDFMRIFGLIERAIKKEVPKIEELTLKRLVFSILSQPIFLFIGKDIVEKISPELVDKKQSIDSWVNKSVFYALKMVELEKSFV